MIKKKKLAEGFAIFLFLQVVQDKGVGMVDADKRDSFTGYVTNLNGICFHWSGCLIFDKEVGGVQVSASGNL